MTFRINALHTIGTDAPENTYFIEELSNNGRWEATGETKTNYKLIENIVNTYNLKELLGKVRGDLLSQDLQVKDKIVKFDDNIVKIQSGDNYIELTINDIKKINERLGL